MKNRIDKKEQSIEISELSENIDTVDSSFLDLMNENPNFESTSAEPYFDAAYCPIMQGCGSNNNLYDEFPLMQRKRPNAHYHPTTPYSSHGGGHEYFNPVTPPYDGYYPLYFNEPYPYFIPFMPFGYQLDEYDEY